MAKRGGCCCTRDIVVVIILCFALESFYLYRRCSNDTSDREETALKGRMKEVYRFHSDILRQNSREKEKKRTVA